MTTPPLICEFRPLPGRVRATGATVTGIIPPMFRLDFAAVEAIASQLYCREAETPGIPGCVRISTGRANGATTSARTFRTTIGGSVWISDHLLQAAAAAWRRQSVVARVGRAAVIVYNETDDSDLRDLPVAVAEIAPDGSAARFVGDGWSIVV